MASKAKIHDLFLQDLKSALPGLKIHQDADQLNQNGRDASEDLVFLPELVVYPESAEDVSEIARCCNLHSIPLTTRGAGTGLSGGALPVTGGVVLNTMRMNRILHIDTENLQATIEPGVINYEFQEAVALKGLMYPPDPASWGSCTMGGNVAHSSGGPRALKYGTTRDYILNLEVVLADGTRFWTGANTLKYSTGYNLTHLFIGSEGTLGIVTKIVCKLIPHSTLKYLMLVPFASAVQACKSVGAVFRAGITPCAMEFMERSAMEWSIRYGNLNFTIEDHWKALLLIEVDGFNADVLMSTCESISTLMYEHGASEILFADSAEQQQTLWNIRRKVGEAVKSNSVYKEEDTVVPRAALPELLEAVKEIGQRYGFESVCYGHAGDGNLHVNIIKGNLSDEDWKLRVPEGIKELFLVCKRLGGTISGEHGIGWVQKSYLPIVCTESQMHLMKAIKTAFDPKNILNPGKILPDFITGF